MDRIKELISKMTLEEKASLCSGADNWHTKEIKRLNIPSVMMVDGPHGLRKQEGETDHLGLNESVKAVCFPAACATASSFDVDLMERMGETLGAECQAENVSMLLGPAVNIKRSPLCGRNFEYLSEDPYLAGRMASAYIRGVQSQGVGTSIKHFALNNQETLRMTISSEVSERALREIYLPAFEEAVKESAPRTVMCSYNKINGEYASENRYLLTDILRKEWGYKGCVVSDWGAVNNRVKGLQAGLDLEMPYSGGYNDRQIVKAVQEGRLDEAVLDEAVERVLNVVFAGEEQHRPEDISDKETDHKKALDKAEEMRKLNVERQDLTKSGMEDAFRIVDTEMKNDKVLVVYIPGIHESIAGIIAGKVRERYNKPAIVLTNGDGDFLKGSGRSIEAYSMFEKLSEVRDLMLGFGGHPLAAGLSLKKENLEEFRKQLNVRCGLTEADFVAKVMIDVVMPVDYLTEGFIRQMDILEPFGKGNEKPVFAQQNVSASQAQIIGKNKNVLKIAFNSAVCRNGVCFHDIEEKERILNQDGKLNDFKMLYYPDLNEWQGTVSIQANVLDVC
mgnify:CR=1 FL=1